MLGTFQLPFTEPTVRALLDYAYIFGMRNGVASYENCLFNNYGNLCLVQSLSKGDWDLDLFPAPRLKELTTIGALEARGAELWPASLSTREKLLSFLEKRLGEGFYCSFLLDDYYLESRPAFMKHHTPHACLATGYDGVSDRVALVNYFNLGDSDFGTKWIDFKRFQEAFDFDPKKHLSSGEAQHIIWWYKYVVGYKVSRDYWCELNVEKMGRQLRNYCEATHWVKDWETHWTQALEGTQISFGLNIYKHLANCVERDFKQRGRIDLRQTRLFHEHKCLMLERLQFIKKKTHGMIEIGMIDRIKYLVQLATKVRLLAFEMNRSKDIGTLSALKRELSECEKEETVCYLQIARRLEVGV